MTVSTSTNTCQIKRIKFALLAPDCCKITTKLRNLTSTSNVSDSLFYSFNAVRISSQVGGRTTKKPFYTVPWKIGDQLNPLPTYSSFYCQFLPVVFIHLLLNKSACSCLHFWLDNRPALQTQNAPKCTEWESKWMKVWHLIIWACSFSFTLLTSAC